MVLETLRTLPQPAMVQDETQHGSPHRTQNARTREGLAQTDEQAELQHLRCLVGELRSITVTVDGRKASAADPGGVG